MRMTAPKLKGADAPKAVKKVNEVRSRVNRLTVWDLLWFCTLWLPITLIKYLGKFTVFTIAVAGTGVARGSQWAYRHARPHLAKAGRWTADRTKAGYARAHNRAQKRWRSRNGRPAPALQPQPAMAGAYGGYGGRAPRPHDRTSTGRTHTNQRQQPTNQTAGTATSGQKPAGNTGTKSTNPTSNGIGAAMANQQTTQEFQRIAQAVRPIAKMDPKTAWELDMQLAAFAAIWPLMASMMMPYIENLQRNVGIDPRIIQSLSSNVAVMNDLHKGFTQSRRMYLELYKPIFQAAQHAKIPHRQGFFQRGNAA